MNEPLIFNIAMGRTKPENIRHREVACPFCAVDKLTDILETKGDIIWLMNKYPVLDRTWPTVIIETHDCFSEYSRYSPETATEVLDFSLRNGKKPWPAKNSNPSYILKTTGQCPAAPFVILTAKSSAYTITIIGKTLKFTILTVLFSKKTII